MVKKIKTYLSLIKFSHTLFALPFAFIGYFLAIAQEGFSLKMLILITLAMVFARSAAMAFNRYTDREIDKKNPRTQNREIPAGKVKPKEALALTVVNALLFIATTYFMNKLVFLLSPVALFIVLGYSYTKRFTFLSHVVLGLGLSLAPLGAYLAVTGKFDLLPVLFSVVVWFWVAGFDIIYSLQDYEFDKNNNLKSVPVILGKKNALFLSLAFHFISAVVIVIIGILYDFTFLYWIGSVVFIALLFYQHTIVKYDDLSKVNIAFFNTNSLASIIFAIFVIADIVYRIWIL